MRAFPTDPNDTLVCKPEKPGKEKAKHTPHSDCTYISVPGVCANVELVVEGTCNHKGPESVCHPKLAEKDMAMGVICKKGNFAPPMAGDSIAKNVDKDEKGTRGRGSATYESPDIEKTLAENYVKVGCSVCIHPDEGCRDKTHYVS